MAMSVMAAGPGCLIGHRDGPPRQREGAVIITWCGTIEADRFRQGRHTGPFAGGNPTGRSFAVRHVYIWRIADDGRIIEHWGSRDDLGLLQRLGLLRPTQ
jgi:hypothetical protein